MYLIAIQTLTFCSNDVVMMVSVIWLLKEWPLTHLLQSVWWWGGNCSSIMETKHIHSLIVVVFNPQLSTRLWEVNWGTYLILWGTQHQVRRYIGYCFCKGHTWKRTICQWIRATVININLPKCEGTTQVNPGQVQPSLQWSCHCPLALSRVTWPNIRQHINILHIWRPTSGNFCDCFTVNKDENMNPE